MQIKSRFSVFSACPSAVCVEVSRDGTTSFPVCAPINTSGLTLIKVQLLKSEVVTSVTIRLHKPRDSTTIGLSQIMLLGLTVFGYSGTVRANLSNFVIPSSNVLSGMEEYISKTRYRSPLWIFYFPSLIRFFFSLVFFVKYFTNCEKSEKRFGKICCWHKLVQFYLLNCLFKRQYPCCLLPGALIKHWKLEK